MITLIGISGSLRKGSYNSAVLRAAASLLPPECELAIESIRDIPLYDGDVEAEQGIPAAVARLKDLIAAADALVLITPEYNNGIPGVTKNAIDWLTRPPADSARVWRGKPVALAGASPGNFGTILSQNAWLAVFRALQAELWSGSRLMIPRANTLLDAQGEIGDAPTRDRIRTFMAEFVAHVRARSGGKRS